MFALRDDSIGANETGNMARGRVKSILMFYLFKLQSGGAGARRAEELPLAFRTLKATNTSGPSGMLFYDFFQPM